MNILTKQKILLMVLVLCIIVGLTAYQIGKGATIRQSINPKKEESAFTCPIIKTSPFKGYILSDMAKVTGDLQLIDKPEAINLNKPFIKQEFEKSLFTKDSWESRKFDVDGDGKNETIINANIAMNHTPTLAMIVKNGNIVFEEEGANIWIGKIDNGQGFLLSKTIDWNIGEGETTRYIYKDGGFMPIWTQKYCLVRFE